MQHSNFTRTRTMTKSDLAVFLDMDFTLISCIIPSLHKSTSKVHKEGVEYFTIDCGREMEIYKRPHLDFFLEKVSSRYAQVHVFTAAGQDYADKVLDKLDPNGTIFTKRWYGTSMTDHKTKNVLALADDEINKIDPARFVLIDDNQDYMVDHFRNGILIKEFHVGMGPSYKEEEPEAPPKDDTSLLKVLKLLEELDMAGDVRCVLDKKFEWSMIESFRDMGMNFGADAI